MSERDIFIAARTKTNPSSQAAFLDGACAGDVAVRQRVERLLRADGEHDSFVDEPVVVLPDVDQTETNLFDSSLVVGANADRRDDKEWLQMLSASSRPDSLGRIGHYEVLEFLGTGGFSIVLRALDTNLNRLVAVKLLAPQLASSASSRQRFLREARSAAAVRHENVVQVYAVEEQPLPYLVMEFVPGETLQQRLDRIGRLPVPDVIEIGRQIAEGLAAAHATGLIHRDVKPANVFLEQVTCEPGGVSPRTTNAEQVRGLTPSGSPSTLAVKLLDFGLARAVDDVSITQSGMIIGTPLYMSPEQARSESLDHRTDLFSLGSVLYAMTTGRSPFRADNTLVTLRRVAEETPQSIEELAPETPRWLCDLIAKLLAKSPSERMQSAREVSALLLAGDQFVDRPISRNALASGCIVQKPDASAFRLMRHRWQRLLVTTLAAVLVFGAILLSFKTQNGEVFVELPEGVSPEIAKELSIKMSGKRGMKVANKANGWTIGVDEGEYDVQLSGGDDRIRVKDNQVTVERNKRTIVKVIWKSNEVARSGDRPQPGPSVAVGLPTEPPIDPDRRVAEWLRRSYPTFGFMVQESKLQFPRGIAVDQPLPATPFKLFSVGFRGEECDRLGDGLAEALADGLRGARLEIVYFDSNSITNAGLAKVLRLPGFSNLTAIYLGGDKFDDGLFAELAQFSTLTNLNISNCPRVTGKGLLALRTLPQFWILSMTLCPISPDGLSELRQLPHLRYLNISASPLTAAHVTELAQTPLQELIAGATNLDNEQAARLAQMRSLNRLHLVGNKQITDELLTTLSQCDWLKQIELSLTGVSAAGVEKLKQALPKCKVTWQEK